ncbi:MAG: glycosyltransferase family 39 protein [Planctomycetales bacterium]|nr:glycosyltransferase family 39 protein [Planctomycetales bacterium]
MPDTSDVTNVSDQQPLRCSVVLLLLAIGVAFALYGINEQGMWYDELYSATLGAVPLLDVVETVRRFDMHPPLYYLQLSLWEAVSQSDLWLRLNSTVWWLASGVALTLIARRLFSNNTAYLALALFVFNASGVHFAQELRMYALLMLLTVLCFYATEQFWRHEERAPSGLLYVITVTVIYSHGAGFLILLSMWASAAWVAWQRLVPRHRLLRFAAVQFAAILTGLPEHLRAATMHLHFEEGLSYAIAPSPYELLRDTVWLITGRGELLGALSIPITLSLTVPILWAGTRTEGPARRALLAFVITPIATCCAISHLSRPIWVFRAISFTLPLLCLTLAVGSLQWLDLIRARLAAVKSNAASEAWPVWQRLTTMLLPAALLVWCLFGVIAQRTFYPLVSHYREAAEVVARAGRVGDTIYVPQSYGYWAFCWYALGPGSIQPLHDAGQHELPNGVLVVKGRPEAEPRIVETKYVATESDDAGQHDLPRTFLLMYGKKPAAKMIAELQLAEGIEVRQFIDESPVGVWQIRSN